MPKSQETIKGRTTRDFPFGAQLLSQFSLKSRPGRVSHTSVMQERQVGYVTRRPREKLKRGRLVQAAGPKALSCLAKSTSVLRSPRFSSPGHGGVYLFAV